MAKYETTIKIKARERIPDLRTILEGLFYRKPELSQKAESFIYALIKRKRIPAKEWEALQKEFGCTHQEYYTMIDKLRDAGMITKVDGEWILSEQFANRCQEMADIWQSFIKRWKTPVS
ncbi:MAG: hypothetical protein J7K68_04715 [Candidatus Diapherotrites archaeon]|nr:hypothetical protein [Candidatus Diapherotrites archaeon]